MSTEQAARENWTAMPHWVVMALDGPGEEHCAGHHPTYADAQRQRRIVARTAWRKDAWIQPTAGHTEAQARETERAYKATT